MFSVLACLAALLLFCSPVRAARHASVLDSLRAVYTEERPLLYVDAWDLWPYCFLDNTGEPVGFNIDLLRLVFNELHIPFRIKLKPLQDAMDDLRDGRAHLMLGMDMRYFHPPGSATPSSPAADSVLPLLQPQYGKSVIQIFTHSVAHRKGEPHYVRSIDDLATQPVIVHEGGITHHLMKERGWAHNATCCNDLQEALQEAHSSPGSQVIGNTLTLKWLIHKFAYDDLVYTPVNIPHGEYKFMSADARLLDQMDSCFALLSSTGRLQPIQNKWFYPDYKDTGIPSWVWYVVAALLLLIAGFIAYFLSYRHYERKMSKSVKRNTSRLSLILNTSKVHIWLFDAAAHTVTSIDPGGRRKTLPLSPDFADFYVSPADFERLCSMLEQMDAQSASNSTTVRLVPIHVVSKASREERVFSMDLSVMRRSGGRTPIVIGASTDITDARQRQQRQKDTMLRYRHIFNSALVDTVSYDENGIMDDLNEKAKKGLGCDIGQLMDARISVQDVLGEPDLPTADLEYTYLTQIYKSADDERALNRTLRREELYYELQLVPVRTDDGRLLGIYGTGRDVTEIARTYSRLQKKMERLKEATDELQGYIRNIDYLMKNGGVRVVNYSPDTHTLTIFSEIEHVQRQLTQTRLLSLVADESRRTALRIMNSMDSLSTLPVQAVIRTTLRAKSHTDSHDTTPSQQHQASSQPLYLYFSFVPVTDADGKVTKYFGMCRDVSDVKTTEARLEQETKKAQEVETVKNAFLHNMCYEIRTPLNSVLGFAELMENNPGDSDEKLFIEEIKKNSRSLLNLVNNILLLSRLEAGMIEVKTTPVEFPAYFEGRCRSAWQNLQKPGVEYIVESPYDRLLLDIDLTNLGVVIDQVVANAAQHTTKGYVRAHFDYNGELLTVTVQDTGTGIPPSYMGRIFERFVTTDSGNSGLGLPICQEIVNLMGGRIHLKSEVGKGTIFWIIIPCTEPVKIEN